MNNHELEIKKLRDELEVTKLKLIQLEDWYKQLKCTSEREIKIERSATITQINKRIEHELKKLERCFKSKGSLDEARQIGLIIIDKIKDQLIVPEYD